MKIFKGLTNALEIVKASHDLDEEAHIIFDSTDNVFIAIFPYKGLYTDKHDYSNGRIDVSEILISKLNRKVNYANCRFVALRYLEKNLAIINAASELAADYVDSIVAIEENEVSNANSALLADTIENNLEEMTIANTYITADYMRMVCVSNWKKGEHNRDYYEIRCYTTNGKYKCTYRCGYIDKVSGEYVTTRFDHVNALTKEYIGK